MESIFANSAGIANKIILTFSSTIRSLFLHGNWEKGLIVLIDILLVALFFYAVFLLVRGTRGMQILWGFAILGSLMLLGKILNLATFNWLINRLLTMLIVAIPVVFQPELRRILGKVGQRGILAGKEFKYQQIINPVAEAVKILSRQKTGALIVFQKKVGLDEYIETGIPLSAQVTTELILNIFTKGAPLHDGAVILQGERIAAAGCMLPLSEKKEFLFFGTRHRAGLGLSEVSDAVVIVVSEEKGTMTLFHNEKIYRDIKDKALIEKLKNLLRKSS